MSEVAQATSVVADAAVATPETATDLPVGQTAVGRAAVDHAAENLPATNLDGMYIRPIARIRTDYPQKFGIPRQSGLVADAQGTIVFEPEFAKAKVVKGLEDFTHLWLIWHFQNGFEGGGAQDIPADVQGAAAHGVTKDHLGRSAHQVVEESLHRRWATTVRPPRLGGSVRKGVFATRSPFRPNPLGLSCVKIDRIEITPDGPLVHVLGADLRDGTPIFDIKPYLPLADCWPEASGGFTEDIAPGLLKVSIAPQLLDAVPREKRTALLQVLENDPRPVGQFEAGHLFTLAYAGLKVDFVVEDQVLQVTQVAAL